MASFATQHTNLLIIIFKLSNCLKILHLNIYLVASKFEILLIS